MTRRDYFTNPAGHRSRITPRSRLNSFLGPEPQDIHQGDIVEVRSGRQYRVLGEPFERRLDGAEMVMAKAIDEPRPSVRYLRVDTLRKV